jgi:membrane protease subunit (stomatin/prohibitin family)
MGLFDAFKGELKRQFIARPDSSKDQILYKWPDRNIRMLSQLTVQQDEKALFFKGGEFVGQLEAGTHTLDGKDIPFLGGLIDSATGGNFLISELYFVSTRKFTNQPFGGMIDNVLDSMTGLAVGIRLHGEYSIKVNEPKDLILNLVGTQNLETNEEVTDWTRELILKEFRETVSEYVTIQKQPVLGLASQSTEFEKLVIEKLIEELKPIGINIDQLGNVEISIKEEDEQTLKQMTRDFAYANNAAAADVAVKLGMAQGLQNSGDGNGAGNSAASAAATGMGLAMGMNMVGQSNLPKAQMQSSPDQNTTSKQAAPKPESKPE